MPRLHLFHTNDFHGRLTDEKAAKLKAEVARLSAGEPFVLLDAGDAISAGNLGFNPLGEPILSRMSALGYDAMTMGNRETHPSLAVVRTKLSKATFPILCANGYAKNTAGNVPFVPFVLRESGGRKIGIFGVTVPMATPQKIDAALWDNLFAPPIETAKHVAAELRPQCDLLIALTHIGIAQDRKLAEAVPELDLLIGGHTHVVLEQLEIVNGVPIVQAGSHARYLGHVIFEDGNVTGALHSL
ncbi:metallophosphatase [Armatimonas sp.]|uniref:bifunctional metallophosphatase/5'-nucleotidase n=1 Tax=Armatimonas sp. TaxID=1872638 RepID=UPI00286B0DEC|nr:metallophosphatase [Armatimonas sp.]